MGNEYRCITEVEEFQTVCVNEAVLKIAHNLRCYIKKQRRKLKIKDAWNNDSKRFTAYGQFIFWIFGHPLGKKIRKILPNCVYHYIRQRFPSDKGTTDFIQGDNDDIFID